MLEARITEQPQPLSVRIQGDDALAARIGEAYIPGGLDQHRPATREQLGEVVVGGGLDVQPSGLLSVAQEVRDGDYATAANKPTVNGAVLDGNLRIEFATEADVLKIFFQ
nr:MAG TPA: hypothetical protein [Caudoviricetes sp.]